MKMINLTKQKNSKKVVHRGIDPCLASGRRNLLFFVMNGAGKNYRKDIIAQNAGILYVRLA